MTRDIDDLLRRLAAQEQPTPADAERVRARVRQLSAEPARLCRLPRPVFWSLAASFCVLLLAAGLWQDVGTEDFMVGSAELGQNGKPYFPGRHFYMNAGDLSKEEVEEYRAKDLAREYRLASVGGFTIKGRTTLSGRGSFSLTTGQRRLGTTDLECALNDDSPAALRIREDFWSQRDVEKVVRELKASGVSLPDTTIIADGLPFRCERRRIIDPEFGPVILWKGRPAAEGR